MAASIQACCRGAQVLYDRLFLRFLQLILPKISCSIFEAAPFLRCQLPAAFFLWPAQYAQLCHAEKGAAHLALCEH